MVKATLKSAVLLGLIALGVCAASVPSFAEVQNVRVGGDITVRGFLRQNLDLNEGEGGSATAAVLDDEDAFVQHTTGLNVGADLTENVSAFVRIVSERDWNLGGTAGTSTAAGDIDISQSHITLKNFFYLPGDVRIGTQPITWGRGFVLGSNLIPGVVGFDGDRNSAISADEFTDFTAFDAARATFDFSGNAAVDLPITLDLVYIKGDENNPGSPDDVNIMGFNVGSKFDSMNGEAEMYYLNKRDKSPTNNKDGSINTIGVRGSGSPVEGSSVYGELAYQFGTIGTDATGHHAAGTAQQAWAMNLGADYMLADVQMTPKIGAEWIFFSGKDNNGAAAGWDPIARGYFTTALREFQNVGFYLPDQTCFRNGTTTAANCTGSATNQHQLSLYGSLKPLEDLTVAPRLSWFILDVGALPVAGSKRNSFAGTELDVVTTYNYTDDVQLGLIYGLFLPGSVYRTPTDSTAQELISSVSVKF